MKTTAIATILSAISLGGVVVLALKVDALSEQISNVRSTRSETRNEEAPRYVINKTGEATRGTPETARNHAPANGASETAEHDEIESLRAEVAELKKRVERHPAPAARWRAPKFVRNMDDLASQLELTATQKDRIADAVQRGKDRIDAVLAIPGPDGKSPKQVREDSRKELVTMATDPERDTSKMIALAMKGHRAMEQKIPGRNETYREEVERIHQETRKEIESNLDEKQAEAFQETHTNGLVGASGAGGGTIAVSTTFESGDDSKPGGVMIVESETSTSADGKKNE